MLKGSFRAPGIIRSDFLVEFFPGFLQILTGPFQGIACRKGKEGEQKKKQGNGPFHGYSSFLF
jgi:hypothetical protein